MNDESKESNLAVVPVSRFLSLYLGEEYEMFQPYQILENQEKHQIWIHLKPISDPAVVPGTDQKATNSNGEWSFKQEIPPIQGNTVYVVIHQKRWIVPGTDLRHPKTFTTRFEGIQYGLGFSETLINEIFTISLLTSAAGCERICASLGIKVSDQYIRNLYRKIEIEDDPDVKFVGIDDVSLRKGMSYRTIIYRGDDHHPLALLDGRDGSGLEEWLKKHPNIQVVARDRAGAFAKAINNVLPNALQVADKFHLFQNLMFYIKKMLKGGMPKAIYLQNGKILDKEPSMIEVPVIPVDNPSFSEVRIYPVENSGGQPPDYKQRITKGKKFEDALRKREEKYKTITAVQQEWLEGKQAGLTKLALEKKYKISRTTLNKYLEMSQDQLNELLKPGEGRRKVTEAEGYLYIIYDMYRQGYRPGYIFSYVLYLGFKGSLYQLRNIVSAIGINNFEIIPGRNEMLKSVLPPDVIMVSRMEILKWITIKDKNKMKDTPAAEYYSQIKEKYPIIIDKIQSIWNDFHEALMNKDRDTSLLDRFLERYKNSGIAPFVRSIKKDIKPVRAAISSGITSGFVEGMNARYKLTQKLMFGKSGIDMLFRKNYAISSLYHLGKSPKEIRQSKEEKNKDT